MVAITPYPKYSNYEHTLSKDLIPKGHEIFKAIFPDDSHGGPLVSALLVTASAGKYTLLLADALSFVSALNSTDALSELCPVNVIYSPRTCSVELQQVVRDYGNAIKDSPPLIALEIGTRSYSSRLYNPGYSGPDPQQRLIQVINAKEREVYIGEYRITRIKSTWQPPSERSGWRGLAFEQSDRVIRTWLHEANPEALQSAREEAQSLIDTTSEEQTRKDREIERLTKEGHYTGYRKERLDQQRNEIHQALQEARNKHQYLNAQTVNSAGRTTLQCAITMQIDQIEKIQLLERLICHQIVIKIDNILAKFLWSDLTISINGIENFIRQKLTALKRKLPALIANQGKTLTNWTHFRDEILQKKAAELRQTFKKFCEETIGIPNPIGIQRQQSEESWKKILRENLSWITEKLQIADEDLKRLRDNPFVESDIRIFEDHKDHILRILRAKNLVTYRLSLELQELYAERDLLRYPDRHHGCVHLVKRLADDGQVYFGVCQSPDNPYDRPDPNSDLNEVHIPLQNIPNPIPLQNIPNPGSSSYSWKKWIPIGVAGVAGGAIALAVLFKRFVNRK